MKSLLIALLVAAGVVTVPAQQPTATPPRGGDQQPPVTFKVEVNYVEIDASVFDSSGNFVRNLTKEDFVVVEEGKPQTVSVFSLIDIPVDRPDAPLFSPSAIEPDVRSNRNEFDGRVFVLVLDNLHTHFARTPRVRAAVKQFIERHLGANDVAAIVTTGGGRDGAQEFTSSRRLLLRAVDTFSGRKTRSATLEKLDDYNRLRSLGMAGSEAPRDLSEPERAHNARSALSTLKSVADFMAGVRGRRKAVVFFSEGIDYDITNPIQNRYASDILSSTRDAITAATRANVSFYGIDPRGLGELSDEGMELSSLPEDNSLGPQSLHSELRLSQDSLRTISEETGGFAAVNRNDFREAFDRIIRDNSSYYLLGYYSNDTRRDGRFRKVEVRVARPGMTVRSRKGYTPLQVRPTEISAANRALSPELREALGSPIPISGLGLSLFAAPFKGSGNNASVALTLEINGQDLKFTEKDGLFLDDIEVSVAAVDQSAKIKDGGRDVVNLKLRPQTHAAVSKSGLRVARRLTLPPGRYQLRVGAREAGGGAVGSVLYDLEVPDFSKAPLSMSGVLLASAYANMVMPTPSPDPELKDVLPAQPTAIREFPGNDTLALFTEVYDNQTRTPHRVEIKTSILADDGRVVYTASDERRSEELQGARGGYGYSTKIELKGLAKGRYVLRVEAQTLISEGARAMRELEFAIR